MTKAAVQLGMSQSAISKRIAALEEQLDIRLIEPQGRGVRLTQDAKNLIERTQPLVIELKQAALLEPAALGGHLSIGISDSLLASWLAPLLTNFAKAHSQISLQIHAHRSPVAIEKVQSGEYSLAIVAGSSTLFKDLSYEKLCDEELVVVPAALQKFRWNSKKSYSFLGIEKRAATSSSQQEGLRRLREKGWKIELEQQLENFAAIVQLAKAGFAAGIAPKALALHMGVDAKKLQSFPEGGLRRQISVVGRALSFSLPAAVQLRSYLLESSASQSRALK